MRHDKKADGNKLAFILVHGLGHAFVGDDVPPEAVRTVLAS
jgi:3-dehydroquinate synthetase